MLFKSDRRRKQFLETVYPHLNFVFNVAFRLSGNHYDAEDLTQETFTVAFQKLHQLKEPGKCRYWLLAILRNLYLRGGEKQRPELLEVAEDDDYCTILESLVAEGDPEKELIQKTAAQEVQRILLGLPEKYKTPLVLFYGEEWSYQEIAEGLEMPIGTVMSRLGRGRELMKRKLLEGRRRQEKGKVIKPLFAMAARTGGGR